MGGFIFKQKGTDTHVPRASIPGLTVRHLQYIATRPGAVYNPGCGFSLWGKLEKTALPGNIDDLEAAKRLVRAEAQRGRTIYRAVISLGEPEAADRGYYERDKWEALTKSQIRIIAEKLHMAPENLRYLASMHYAEGHPHAHLLYWDAGKEPRAEYMPPEKFAAYSESVRASLNRYEFGEEIRQRQTEQADSVKQLRLELRAMCRECNGGGGLNVKALLKSEKLQSVCDRLDALVRDMPAKGSLKYAYLPQDYKLQLNGLLREIQSMPEFAGLVGKYLDAAGEISRLYGNGEAAKEAQIQKAMDKLDREMGNEILSAIRQIKEELISAAPTTPEELEKLAVDAVRSLARDSPYYKDMQNMLPRDRIPIQRMRETPGWVETERRLLSSLLSDARVRVPLNAYAKENGSDWKKSYSEFFRAAQGELCNMLREDAGYTAEARQTGAVTLCCALFRLLGQMTRQNQASASLSRSHSRDLSREARKDKAQQASQGDGWEPDM